MEIKGNVLTVWNQGLRLLGYADKTWHEINEGSLLPPYIDLVATKDQLLHWQGTWEEMLMRCRRHCISFSTVHLVKYGIRNQDVKRLYLNEISIEMEQEKVSFKLNPTTGTISAESKTNALLIVIRDDGSSAIGR